jgi:hypothetical protein
LQLPETQSLSSLALLAGGDKSQASDDPESPGVR